MASKKVKFYFFHSYVNQSKVSVGGLFDGIYNEYEQGKKDNQDTTNLSYAYAVNLTSGPIRLRNILKDEHGYYVMTFDRFQHTIPKVSKIFSDSEDLNIEDDEFISHEISVLYDPANMTFILQRNINSLNERSVEFFINYLNKELNGEHVDDIELSVIKDPDASNKFRNAHAYKNITFRTHHDYAQGVLERMFGEKSDNLEYLEIKMVAARGKNLSLNPEYAETILNIDGDELKKVTAKVIVDEDDNITPIDFFDQKLLAIESFSLDGREDINHFAVKERMVDFYRSHYSQRVNR